MNAKVVQASHPEAITQAQRVIATGGLIAFPTDTVYGLAGDVQSAQSIDRIYHVKGRDLLKAIPILVGSLEQLSQIVEALNPLAQALVEHFWPGALTLVLPSHPGLPCNLSPYPTVGVRMPNHSFALELLQKTGPLAVTSANISNQPDAITAEEVTIQLGENIELIIDGGKTLGAIPSTVVDCVRSKSAEELFILRQGLIPREAIVSALRDL